MIGLDKTVIVVWEGLDGAGKTTLMNRVKQLLEERGYRVIAYKTPSDTPTGRFAKDYGNIMEIDPLTRTLLFLANTSDDSKIMKKEIEEKTPDYYFIDRYYLCSIVYGFALLKLRGSRVDEKLFAKLLSSIEELGEKIFLKPDLYVIVDAPEESRIKRVKLKASQGRLEEALERDQLMQEYVKEFYRIFKKLRPEKVLWIINLEGMLEEAASRVVDELIRLRGHPLRRAGSEQG